MGHGWGSHKAPKADRAERARVRRNLTPYVASGRASCWRCGTLIARDQPWHVGHSDDGGRVEGPEHEDCNLRAASAEAHRRRWRADPEAQPRTRW